MVKPSGKPSVPGAQDIDALLEGLPVRAGHFIVTLYGDVVEPRGGRLWMGNIIETCAAVGISETLVRTAVSRLVAAGRLEGLREGRRSYYALSAATREEFAQASRILYDPPERKGFVFAHSAGLGERNEAAVRTAGFVSIGPGWWLGPATAWPATVQAAIFRTDGAQGGDLPALAESLWALAATADAYRAFTTRFSRVDVASRALRGRAPRDALILRLLLVDRFRAIALRDPRLPHEMLPVDWAGARARSLFARLYLTLSPAAEAHIAQTFVSDSGPLAGATSATQARGVSLSRHV